MLAAIPKKCARFRTMGPPNAPPDAKFFNQSDFTFTLEKARD